MRRNFFMTGGCPNLIIGGYVTLFYLLAGCAHQEFKISPQLTQNVLKGTVREFDLTASGVDIRAQALKIKTLIGKDALNENGIHEVENFYALYQIAKGLKSKQSVILPPRSKVKIGLSSFCLDPSKNVPAENEVFDWKQKDPSIHYYPEIAKLYAKRKLEQKDAQELIWNLRNKSNYEDYPPRYQEVLNRIDPKAKFILPSRVNSAIRDEAKEMVRDKVPGLRALQDKISLVEGRYYSYSEISDLLRRNTREDPISPEPKISRITEGRDIYASTTSSGFSKQIATFYNPNPQTNEVEVSEYFLDPSESDTQRIGLTSDPLLGEQLVAIIESTLKDAIVRNSAYWYSGRLTPDETAFIQRHPIEALNAYAQSRRAILSAWQHFGKNSDGDESDAFRHFVWASLLSKYLGDPLAQDFLSSHEQLLPNATSVERLASEMDRYNNSEGLKAAKEISATGELSLDKIEKKALDALEQRKLRILHPKEDSSLYRTKQ